MLAILLPATSRAQAAHVPIPEEVSLAPQLELAGVGVGTLELSQPSSARGPFMENTNATARFDDSALLLGAAQRLYRGAIGSFTLGALRADRLDGSSDGGFFIHQAVLDFQTLPFEAFVGRTDSPPAMLVDFPTLRSDDLVTFTTLLDPDSDGVNLEENRYADVAAVTFNQGLRVFENLHAQRLFHSAGGGQPGLDSFGATLQLLAPPGLEALQRLVSLGGGYEYRTLPAALGGASQATYAGGILNLYPSMVNRVDLRVQDVYTFGNTTDHLVAPGDSFRADANATAASLRWLHSPFGVPGFELAATFGYRSLRAIPDADSAGLALLFAARLGQGFDLVAQSAAQWRGAALAAFTGGGPWDASLQLGLVYSYQAIFNEAIGPRRSLLNLQHQYIPE